LRWRVREHALRSYPQLSGPDVDSSRSVCRRDDGNRRREVARAMTGRLRWFVYAAVLVAVLGAIAALSPLPDRVTDRGIYEQTAAYGIVRDCNDLHCFRALVAWTLGVVPAPSTLKWRAYAVVCNAVAAVLVMQLCLTFGLSRRAAWTASLMSALGFGA